MVTPKLGLLALPLVLAACGAAIKDVKFDVQDNGRTVTVSKFFNDGFGGDNPSHHAFEAVQKNDVAGAKKILADDIAAHPNDEWTHYNLAILDEATADWAGAESELLTAEKLTTTPKHKPLTRFTDELVFVRAHKK